MSLIKPADMTSSEFIRKKGNVAYKTALEAGLSPVIKLSRLENALKLNNQAAGAAGAANGPCSQKDWSSATKNCGIATKRMAQEYRKEKKEKEKGYAKTLTTFMESLKLMSQALVQGTPVHGQDWGTHLQDEMRGSYLEIVDIANNEFDDTTQKLRELYRVTRLLPDSVVLAIAKYDIAEVFFKDSVRLLESSDYKECLRFLHEIHQPVEEALSILSRVDNFSSYDVEGLTLDLKVLKRDAQYHICTAESIQARKFGETLLAELLFEEEFLNMDMVWNAVDWFKQASLKAAELDLEQEAAALSFLGLINEKICFKTNSKRYYKKCLVLVEAAKPKTFLSHQWYKQCVEGFKKIQDAERLRDEAEQEKIREKILGTLEDEMTALTKANTNATSLMEHILQHHPTRNDRTMFTKTQLDELKQTEGKITNEEKKSRKKLLLKALQDFHPDKIRKTEGETDAEIERRKVLTGEITKMITAYYEIIKLLP